MRNGNNTILFGNEVLDVEVLYVAGNLGAARMGVLILYLVEVLTDDVQDQGFLGQNSPVTLDLLSEVGVFLSQLLDLQAGKTL